MPRSASTGNKTAFIGKVGADTFGRLLRRTMQHAGIETKGIVEDPEVFTTLAFVTFDASGDRSFSFARKPGADTQLRWDEVNLHLIDEARVFHFGTLSLTDEPARTHHTAGSRLREGEGQAHHLRPQPARAALENPGGGKGADALESYTVRRRQNQRQRGCVSLGLFAEEGAQRLLEEFDVSSAMVTLGPDGCLLKTKQALFRAPAPAVHPVDTTGAGDIFGGSAVARLLELGKAPEQLATQDDLSYIGGSALTAASLSTEHSGGIPSIPSKEAVLAAMQTGART